MHTRLTLLALLASGALMMNARPAAAQQTLNFSLGYFTVRGEDARVEGDVLNANRGIFVFDIDDFNGATVGGEWLVPLGEYFEAGAGLSFSRRTVPSVYADFVDVDGSEIEQDFRLRLLPVAFTVRVLPLRQTSPGAAVLWRRPRADLHGVTVKAATSSTSSGRMRFFQAASSPRGPSPDPLCSAESGSPATA